MYIIVMYDVDAKRTTVYRKLLSRYLCPLQYSVFGGDITCALWNKLVKELVRASIPEDDIMCVSTENRRNVKVELLKNGEFCADTSHLGSKVI